MEKKKATQSELKWRRTSQWRVANGWRASTLKWEDPDPIKNGWLTYWSQEITAMPSGDVNSESQSASMGSDVKSKKRARRKTCRNESSI